MDENKIQEIEQAAQRANDEINRICTGERKFTMSIPARPENDSDLVIAAGLAGVKELADEARRGAQYREAAMYLAGLFSRLYDDSQECVSFGCWLVDERFIQEWKGNREKIAALLQQTAQQEGRQAKP